MRRAWVAVALLLLVPTTGCLDGDTYSDLWTDLEARDRFGERTLFEQTVEFTPTGIVDPNEPPQGPEDLPGGLEDIGHTWTGNVSVPEGTRQLTVVFRVNFSTTDAQEPLPADPPDGDIFLFVEGPNPANESQNITVEEPITAGFDFTNPSSGDWTVGFEARGDGTVTWRVIGLVPLEPRDDPS